MTFTKGNSVPHVFPTAKIKDLVTPSSAFWSSWRSNMFSLCVCDLCMRVCDLCKLYKLLDVLKYPLGLIKYPSIYLSI